LRFRAEYRANSVALLSWSAIAFKLELLEEWIGRADRQERRRLPLMFNNSRSLIVKEFYVRGAMAELRRL